MSLCKACKHQVLAFCIDSFRNVCFIVQEYEQENKPVDQYIQALRLILRDGVRTGNRTGIDTISHFGLQCRYPLADGFPLVTTKRVYLRGVVHELLWFLSGDTNVRYLQENNVNIWNEWADENADLGPIYGEQWRRFACVGPGAAESTGAPASPRTVDQIEALVQGIRETPDSRRLIVSAWNPGQVEAMALPPCHVLWQVRVVKGRLHLQFYQRSADMFLGVPFNIASYALLAHMLAHVTGNDVGDLVHSIGDAHIYTNHLEAVETQLARTPRPLPRVRIVRNVGSIFKFRYEDFAFDGYDPHPAIKAPVAV